ncbi:MAG: 4Fe-4S dicluster domain-containing protein [Candidatus Aenigmarchaeota archaeon]|nr:4Fe-4S dicluster domain-containing protein [Candidatus Aenigmarchaeota archaeon]
MGLKKEVFKNLFKEASTKKYPFQKIKPYERFRGKITFNKSECVGCGLCRAYCPAECIKLSWKKKKIMVKGVEHQKIIHPIDEINIGKCIQCGLCIDVCPVKCIWFTHEFELADKDKEKLISETV